MLPNFPFDDAKSSNLSEKSGKNFELEVYPKELDFKKGSDLQQTISNNFTKDLSTLSTPSTLRKLTQTY